MKVRWQRVTLWGASLITLILVFCLILLFTCSATSPSSSGPLVGGSCTYKQYKGEAEIVSIRQRSGALQEFEIRFSFHPQETVLEEFARIEGKTWQIVRKDSSNPGKEFLAQYDLKAGKRFSCNMKVITRGTCTPVLFDFPTIDQSQAQ